jgi:hypothetical protein
MFTQMSTPAIYLCCTGIGLDIKPTGMLLLFLAFNSGNLYSLLEETLSQVLEAVCWFGIKAA